MDAYMAQTKGGLDKEIDSYMNRFAHSQAISSGIKFKILSEKFSTRNATCLLTNGYQNWIFFLNYVSEHACWSPYSGEDVADESTNGEMDQAKDWSEKQIPYFKLRGIFVKIISAPNKINQYQTRNIGPPESDNPISTNKYRVPFQQIIVLFIFLVTLFVKFFVRTVFW